MAMIDRKSLLAAAVSRWGSPYNFGSKWNLQNKNPTGPIDCSGFVRWCYAQIGISIPDGSTNQFLEATPESFVLPGDQVFLHVPNDPNQQHHTGLVYDGYFIIEARGIIEKGVEKGSVMLRPRSEWEARPDFAGYRRPKQVVQIEGA